MTTLAVLALFGLVLANAYFVATEFALVAVRRSEVQLWQAEGRRGAAAAARAIERLDDAIAATQLGITIASIGLGFLG
ncbi:MAG TPA: CNNM domain-containing protein, partial [Myxococcota bacterium]|nr:CNNM domain-containing protein [Myxococcota bacterium]